MPMVGPALTGVSAKAANIPSLSTPVEPQVKVVVVAAWVAATVLRSILALAFVTGVCVVKPEPAVQEPVSAEDFPAPNIRISLALVVVSAPLVRERPVATLEAVANPSNGKLVAIPDISYTQTGKVADVVLVPVIVVTAVELAL